MEELIRSNEKTVLSINSLSDRIQKLEALPSRVQKLELLPTSIDAVKSEVKKLSDSQASFERLCDGIQSDLEVLKSSFDALTLPSTTTSVNTEGMGRAERDSQLVILGTKLKSRETTADLLSILALIGCVLGLTFNTHDVHSIHRPKSKGNPIIVKFISTIIRDEWIAAKRKKDILKLLKSRLTGMRV